MKNTQVPDNSKNFSDGEPGGFWRRFKFTEQTAKLLTRSFFVVLWLLLVICEHTQLYRIQDLSLFLPTELFFKEMMTSPAGLLSYIACFLVQFFYYPALGATIYVALLYVVYRLVRNVFEIPMRWSVLSLFPVTLLLATNMSMGYWIYYIKLAGYFYVALLGVIVMLLAMQLYKKLPVWAKFIFVVLWSVAYPLIGVYAIVGWVFMGLYSFAVTDRKISALILLLLSLFLAVTIPWCCFGFYTSTSFPLMYGAGIPAYQWTLFGSDWFAVKIWTMWLPFAALFLVLLFYTLFFRRIRNANLFIQRYQIFQVLLFLFLLCITWAFWYYDENYRVELAQNEAMWNEDWERVAELGDVSGVPTRLVVINRNIALLRIGRGGEDMFRLPDGSANMNSRLNVRLAQTGGKMAYYQYGRFSFCYRWCVEDAVEYGWRVEFLKHAIRSMVASGEYKLAHRYIEILKKTLFHKSWAERFEKLIEKPQSINKVPEISIPRQLCCYKNTLDIDESFVEAYLLSVMTSNLYVNPSPICTEASLMHALIRKDTQLFWNTVVAYLNNHKQLRIPTHYQEALLLYANIDHRADISKFKFDTRIQKRFRDFTKATVKYKGMTEEQMAPYFKDDFGDTYWYFYFFVRDIKSN